MPVLSPPTISTVRSEDAAAVQALVAHLTAAWNVNDAQALSTVYREDASIVLPGAILIGRPEIESWMAAAFASKWKGTHVFGHPIDLRYLGDDVVIMISHGGAYHPGDSEVPETSAIRGVWVFVKEHGEWLIQCYSNTPVQDTIPLPAANQ